RPQARCAFYTSHVGSGMASTKLRAMRLAGSGFIRRCAAVRPEAQVSRWIPRRWSASCSNSRIEGTRMKRVLFFAFSLSLTVLADEPDAKPASSNDDAREVNRLLNRIIAKERLFVEEMGTLRPLVETYIQELPN